MEKKMWLLIGKFGAVEHEKYANQTNIRGAVFTFKFMMDLFESYKKHNEYQTTFATVANRGCKLSERSQGMFKCLTFVQRLTTPKYAEIRSRWLTKVEQDQKITL